MAFYPGSSGLFVYWTDDPYGTWNTKVLNSTKYTGLRSVIGYGDNGFVACCTYGSTTKTYLIYSNSVPDGSST